MQVHYEVLLFIISQTLQNHRHKDHLSTILFYALFYLHPWSQRVRSRDPRTLLAVMSSRATSLRQPPSSPQTNSEPSGVLQHLQISSL